MKLLIIGANGYLGARLYFDLKKDFQVVGTYHHKQIGGDLIPLDVTDEKAVERVILEQEPKFIICVANNPNNKWCKEHPEAAVKLNVFSTQYIVENANKTGAKVIYISSLAALVTNTEPYGASKLHSEEIVKTNKAGWIVIRPVVIVGYSPNMTNGRPYEKYIQNITQKTLAVYDNGWKFQPTYIGHISEVIKEVIHRNIVNEIIPLSVLEPKTFYEIGVDLLKSFNITVTPSSSYSRPSHFDDLSVLKRLQLPIYTYPEILEKMRQEIMHKEEYKI